MFVSVSSGLLAASLLLFPQCVNTQQPSASPTAISDPNTSINATPVSSTAAPLQPVLPPSGDINEPTVLSPSHNLTLWWGGVSNPSINKRSTGDSGILVNVAFEFRYPSVALDYSPSISNVSCIDGNSMSGTFDSALAYAIGKQTWANLTNVLLITSAAGCGNDDQIDVFVAQGITFSDDNLSFTASGGEFSIQDVAAKAVLAWGNADPAKLKKRDYRPRAAHTSDLTKRFCFSDCVYEGSYPIDLDYMLSDYPDFPVDPDAPWPDAVLLFSYDSEDDDGGEESNETDNEGLEVRRSEEAMALEERDLGYKANLYCVDCGIQGSFELTGSLTIDFFGLNIFSDTKTIEAAQLSLSGNLYAGLFLGLESEVTYGKTWSRQIFNEPLAGFTIEDLVNVALFTELNANATLELTVEGQVLIGANATWPSIDVTMDLLNPSSSYATGLIPTFQTRVEAETQVGVNLTLGLPVSIGAGITVPQVDLITVKLTDSPSITAGASFTVFSVDTDGDDSDDDDCSGGIEYFLEFDNEVSVNVFNLENYVIDTYNDPLEKGCTATASNSTATNSTADCPNGVPPVSSGNGTTCGYVGRHQRHVHLGAISTLKDATDAKSCGLACVVNPECLSLEYTAATTTCHLYSAPVSDLPILPGKSTHARHVFWDSECWTPCLLESV